MNEMAWHHHERNLRIILVQVSLMTYTSHGRLNMCILYWIKFDPFECFGNFTPKGFLLVPNFCFEFNDKYYDIHQSIYIYSPSNLNISNLSMFRRLKCELDCFWTLNNNNHSIFPDYLKVFNCLYVKIPAIKFENNRSFGILIWSPQQQTKSYECQSVSIIATGSFILRR